jgi:hypothetical protein
LVKLILECLFDILVKTLSKQLDIKDTGAVEGGPGRRYGHILRGHYVCIRHHALPSGERNETN